MSQLVTNSQNLVCHRSLVKYIGHQSHKKKVHRWVYHGTAGHSRQDFAKMSSEVHIGI